MGGTRGMLHGGLYNEKTGNPFGTLPVRQSSEVNY